MSGSDLVDEIGQLLEQVANGSLTRWEAHEWAVPFVEGSSGDLSGIEMTGLQVLHALSMCIDAAGLVSHRSSPACGEKWAHTAEEIRESYVDWVERTEVYRRSPEEYRRVYIEPALRLAEGARDADRKRREHGAANEA